MTNKSSHRLLLSFVIALLLHGGLYLTVFGKQKPEILIEGQSISVQLSTAGNGAVNSAASKQQHKKEAGAKTEKATPEHPKPETKKKKTHKPNPAHKKPAPPAHPPKSIPAPKPEPEKSVPEKPAPENKVEKAKTPVKEAPLKPKNEPSEQIKHEELPKEQPAEQENTPEESPEIDRQDRDNDESETPDHVSEPEAAPQHTPQPEKPGKGKDTESTPESVASAAQIAGSSGAHQGQKSASPGNSAFSNYAGKVMQHLSRFRRPRASGPGSAYVTFTFTDVGEIDSMEISKSSGSHKFDRDAMAFVRKAAPFPAPPKDTSRTFTVKIEGR